MNPLSTEELTCPVCGMEKESWSANHGEGVIKDEEIFCCEGCAEGTGCICEESAQTEAIETTEQDQNRGRTGGRR